MDYYRGGVPSGLLHLGLPLLGQVPIVPFLDVDHFAKVGQPFLPFFAVFWGILGLFLAFLPPWEPLKTTFFDQTMPVRVRAGHEGGGEPIYVVHVHLPPDTFATPTWDLYPSENSPKRSFLGTIFCRRSKFERIF